MASTGCLIASCASLTLGKLEALEQGELLFINRDDFKELCEVVPVLNAHLKAKADTDIKTLLEDQSEDKT